MLDDVRAFVYYGSTPEQAVERIGKIARLNAAEKGQLLAEYVREGEKYIELTDPTVLKGNRRIESWYTGPDFEGAWCWPEFKAMLGKSGWKKEAVDKLDESSTKILAHLPHPATKTFSTRGLVVGYVQSGKTANYSALISKAADVGYKLFIVLAGTTSSLRQQTQGRLEDDILANHKQNWNRLTGLDRDFGFFPGVAEAMLNPANKSGRILAVVKKNKFVLEKLKDFLRKANRDIVGGCPVIMIDDEADNASVNTRADERSAINQAIMEILDPKTLPKVAYIGYTATPFANIFIDPATPEDLFPRDFIFDLPRPKAYFGTEAIFGRDLAWFDEKGTMFEGLDIIRNVTLEEQRGLKPPKAAEREAFEPTIPDSLKDAVTYFVLATACRYARGQDKHSSMLVHTSQYVSEHGKMQRLLQQVVADLKRNWRQRRQALRSQWQSEVERTASIAKGTTSFDDVFEEIPEALERCEVVVDNGFQASRLVYPKTGPGKVYIAVGGNTLSRGLTLEGLVVSYFVRVANAYDTLLQMGRWFGYRFGYADLPRIWLTDELEEYFFFLASIEEEIRHDIGRLEKQGKSPLDLAIRVRTHPKLQITAKQKMGAARIASASYSNEREQSFLFESDNSDWLRTNMDAGRRLAGKLAREKDPKKVGPSLLFTEVGADDIIEFLSAYAFHEDHEDLRRDLLLNYIRTERGRGSLESWNVAIVTKAGEPGDLGAVDLGLGKLVPCVSRSRYKMTEPCNIKALTSPDDRIIDIEDRPVGRLDEKAMIQLRNEKAPNIGLLLLYPISKDSEPYPGSTRFGPCSQRECKKPHRLPPDGGPVQRHPLNAVEHVLGAAVVFPSSEAGDDAYMANNLSAVLRSEEPEQEEAREIAAELAKEVDK
jgi:hypothetical protein